jgi:cell division protein FtsB
VVERLQRFVVPLALLTAAGLLAAWFPFSTLLSQSGQLNATASQIAQLHRENEALAAQNKTLTTKAAIVQLAREDYQLVAPGQRLIQILNSSGANGTSGDPGDQPLKSPANTTGLIPTSPSAPPKTHSNFFGRVLRTLEFWQ